MQRLLQPLKILRGKYDLILLSIFILSFPLSRLFSLGVYAFFLCQRMVSFNFIISRHFVLEKVILYTILIFLLVDFSFRQNLDILVNNHLYPVTIHDYFIFLISFLIIKIKPLQPSTIQNFLYVFSFSPLLLWITNFQDFSLQNRINMGFENSNILGLYLAICLPIIILCLLFNRKLKRSNLISFERIYLLVSLIITTVMLLGSGSKSSLIFTVFNLAILFFWFIRKQLNIAINATKIVFCVSLFTIVLAINRLLQEEGWVVIDRFFNLWSESSQARVEIYRCFFLLGIEKPFFGWSPTNTAQVCENRLGWLSGEVNHAHNFILQIWADYGLITTLLALYFLFSVLIFPLHKYGLKANQVREDKLYIWYALFFSSLTIILVTLLQSAFYHDPLYPLCLGLFLASHSNWLENICKT